MKNVCFLYIEDNSDQAEAMAQLFRAEIGITVIVEAELGEAVTRLATEEINCIILDWELSAGLTGEQAIPLLKEVAPMTAIIIFTGHSEKETREKALELGADDYLVKPLNPRELIRAAYDVTIKKHGQLFGE
jgi:two-component system, OmpR family, response regulator TctD